MVTRGGLYPTPTVVRARVNVWALQGPAIPSTATLNLHVRLATTSPYVPDRLRVTVLNTMVNRLRELLAQTGITLGEVTFSEMPEEWAVIDYGYLEGNELAELFDETLATPWLHVFMVDEVRLPGNRGGVLLGISDGIPGPFALPSVRSTGVAIALLPHVTSSGTIDIDELTATVGHEIGHYLGLFHVTEFEDEDDFFSLPPEDPIDDTTRPYEQFLMHPGALGRDFSPTQSRVMRTGPTVRWP
jgi:hypothetical protein